MENFSSMGQNIAANMSQNSRPANRATGYLQVQSKS